MKIRVAYDISRLAESFVRGDATDGIDRVSEELLTALSQRSDIDLAVVNLCSEGDPLYDSVESHLYFKSHKDKIGSTLAPSFKSRLGLTRFYHDAFVACNAEELSGVANHSLNSIIKRRIRGVLYRLRYTHGIDRVYRQLGRGSYDVFHSPFMPLPAPTITNGIPRVLTVYDLIPILAPELVGSEAIADLRRVLDSIRIEHDWVTCISHHTKAEFCEYTGMAPERVFVTPLAAAPHFHPVCDEVQIAAVRRRYGLHEGPYLLSVAAPQPRKNLAHLIRCFFRLLNEQPGLDATLVLAGSKDRGWLHHEIFVTADNSKHRNRVVFTGFVADKDLAALYSGAVAFIYSSLYEGFGLPPLEAMACGTPIISSNQTALPEVVGDAGILVAPTDEDALCEAMLTLLQNRELRRTLRRQGLERARHFTWANCAEQTANVYRAALSENRPRR